MQAGSLLAGRHDGEHVGCFLGGSDEAGGGLQVLTGGDAGGEAEVAGGAEELLADGLRGAEEAFAAGHVEREGEGGGARQGLDTGGEACGGFHQDGCGVFFFCGGAAQEGEVGEAFDFSARHAVSDAEAAGVQRGGADLFERRFALEHGDGLFLQRGAEAHEGLGGELGYA